MDLKAGPNVDVPEPLSLPPRPGEVLRNEGVVESVSSSPATAGGLTRAAQKENKTGSTHLGKRSADASGPAEHDSAFPKRAHSVAVTLGMLSLNSDSPQKHYLGTSSGLLFANLINTLPSRVWFTPTTLTNGPFVYHEGRTEEHDGAVANHTNQYHRSIFNLLRQVSKLLPLQL